MRQKYLNFVKYDESTVCMPKIRVLINVFLALLFVSLAGCSDNIRTPTEEELVDFDKAGPLLSDLDKGYLSRARGESGAIHVMPGEVLDVTTPAILHVMTAEGTKEATRDITHSYRVSDKGTITLPVAGEIEVAGRTLTEVELSVIDAYYPKYAAVRPSVIVRLAERISLPGFTIIGLVNSPGTFPHPPDLQYNLMQAVALARGMNLDLEPRYATIYRLKADGSFVNVTFHIATDSQFIEASATPIKPGDIIVIEHTTRTRTKAFLDRVFRLNIGAYINARDLWED